MKNDDRIYEDHFDDDSTRDSKESRKLILPKDLRIDVRITSRILEDKLPTTDTDVNNVLHHIDQIPNDLLPHL